MIVVMISSVCIRYEKYTPFKNYFQGNGLIVRAGWGMNKNPNIRNLTDGIENENISELFNNIDKVIASHTVEAYVKECPNGLYLWSYDDVILQNYIPKMKAGHWFEKNDITKNDSVKVVVSENNFNWNVGDKIPVTFVCESEFSLEVEVIGIFKDGESIVGGNFIQKNDDYNDFYYTFDNKFEGIPCMLFSYSQLKSFCNLSSNKNIYQPINEAMITYDKGTPQCKIEEDINQWSNYDSEASYSLKELNSNSKVYLFEQLYNMLPIIILLILLIITSCISISATSTEQVLKNYAIYYINGLQWKNCIFINLIQSAIISGISVLLSSVIIFIIQSTSLKNTITIIINLYTIVSVLALIILYILISMIMPAIIIGKNTPKQILTR